MEISTGPVEWDVAEDRDMLIQFLKTRTGTRLLPKIVESCPTLMASGETNSIMIRNGEVIGFQKAIQALVSLTMAEPPPDTVKAGGLPDLEDDAAWNDGKKLGQSPTK